MRKLKFSVFILIMIIFFNSCEKVETPENLENAYNGSVTIINVPPYYWDNASSPDLQLKLAKKSSTEWTYITNLSYNVEIVPETLLFEEEINITDEDWELELIDYDDLNEDDVIYRITFNPYREAEDDKIPIYSNNLLVLEFNYYVK